MRSTKNGGSRTEQIINSQDDLEGRKADTLNITVRKILHAKMDSRWPTVKSVNKGEHREVPTFFLRPMDRKDTT
jgi:hypothetical protein